MVVSTVLTRKSFPVWVFAVTILSVCRLKRWCTLLSRLKFLAVFLCHFL